MEDTSADRSVPQTTTYKDFPVVFPSGVPYMLLFPCCNICSDFTVYEISEVIICVARNAKEYEDAYDDVGYIRERDRHEHEKYQYADTHPPDVEQPVAAYPAGHVHVEEEVEKIRHDGGDGCRFIGVMRQEIVV